MHCEAIAWGSVQEAESETKNKKMPQKNKSKKLTRINDVPDWIFKMEAVFSNK
jgi:hypothetical protein